MFDTKTRILVVDDMLTMRKLIKKSLKELGFSDVQEAADGDLGFKALKSSVPGIQLVISDWNMPNCTGLEFLAKVRKDPGYSSMPFLLLTAEAEAAQVMEAMKQGVTNYIVKPFSTETLRVKLEQAYKKVAA